MPTIICSWCEYVGQGEEYEDRINDVEEHEKTCEYRAAEFTCVSCGMQAELFSDLDGKPRCKNCNEIDKAKDHYMPEGIFLPAAKRREEGGNYWEECNCGKGGRGVLTDKEGKMWCMNCHGYIPPLD